MGYNQDEARQMFQERYKDYMNPMMSETVEYRMLYENIAIEIAKTRGMDNNTIYGITVLYRCPKGKVVCLHRDNKPARSQQEVEDHLASLKQKYRKPHGKPRKVVTDYEPCDE